MQRLRLSRTQTQKAWRGNQDLGEPRGAGVRSKQSGPSQLVGFASAVRSHQNGGTVPLDFRFRDCVCLHSCTSHAVGITCLWNNSVSYVYIMPLVCKALLYTYLSSHLRQAGVHKRVHYEANEASSVGPPPAWAPPKPCSQSHTCQLCFLFSLQACKVISCQASENLNLDLPF